MPEFWAAVFESVPELPGDVVGVLAANCVKHALSPAGDIPMLTADLLKELGVTKIGHRLAILKRLESLTDVALKLKATGGGALESKANKVLPWKHRHFVVDTYEVEIGEKLGAGSFGEVFYGECRGKEVAVKKLVDVSDAGFRKFQEEIALISSVPHPNICMFMGLVMEPPMILSAYESGGSVQSLLDSGVEISETCALHMGTQLALGMNWLHSRSPPLLHLDLKPANFLLSRPSPFADVKICDFGLSSWLPEGNAIKDVRVRGTLPYVSPERLYLQPYDRATDVYSFALALWHICSRQQPFAALMDEAELFAANQASARGRTKRQLSDVISYMAKKIGSEHVRPSTSHLSSSVVYCLRRYWDSDPSKRPSFATVAEELSVITVKLVFGPHECGACEFWCSSFGRRLSVPFSWFRMELLDCAEVWFTGKPLDCFRFFLEEASQVGLGAVAEPASVEMEGEKHVTAAGLSLFLSCFGPWTVKKDADGSICSNFHSIIASFMELCQYSVDDVRPFFGVLDSKQAKSILKNCAPHTWLLRVSSRFADHPLVISRVDDQQRVTHQRLKHIRESNCYTIDVRDPSHEKIDGRPMRSNSDRQSLVQFLQEVSRVVQLDQPARGSPFSSVLSPGLSREDSYVSAFDIKALINDIDSSQ